MNFDINIDDILCEGFDFFRGVKRVTDNLRDIERLMKIYHFTLLFHKYFQKDLQGRDITIKKIINVLNECSLLMNDSDFIMSLFKTLPEPVKDAISIDASLNNLEIYDYIINFKR